MKIKSSQNGVITLSFTDEGKSSHSRELLRVLSFNPIRENKIFAKISEFAVQMGKREPVALLSWSSWCLVIVVCPFLAVPLVCLQFVIVVFPDHTPLLFLLFMS